MAGLSATQVTALTTTQLAAISVKAVTGLTADQIGSLTHGNLLMFADADSFKH